MKRLLLVLIAVGMVLCMGCEQADDASNTDTMSASEKAMDKYKEHLPQSRFILAAYMIVWAGLFIFLLSLKKRQGTLENQVKQLEQALAAYDEKDTGSLGSGPSDG